jgi:FkbM family methyltransferase
MPDVKEIKNHIPSLFRRLPGWHFLSFLHRLPVYYRQSLSRRSALRSGEFHGSLYYQGQVCIRLPDHAYANDVLRLHAFENVCLPENRAFLALANNTTCLWDLGASGGWFSVLYCRTRPKANVVSVECDPPSIEVLQQVRDRNADASTVWQIVDAAIGSEEGTIDINSSGYGAFSKQKQGEKTFDISSAGYGSSNSKKSATYQVKQVSLETVLSITGMTPEIVKIDIESAEYELIVNSIEFFQRYKPKLHLELHCQQIRDRGHDPRDVIEALWESGYRVFGAPGKTRAQVCAAVTNTGLVPIHLQLAASSNDT